MKLSNLIILLYLITLSLSTKLRLVLKNSSTFKNKSESQMLKQEYKSKIDSVDEKESLIYITFLEGSSEIYGYCESICQKEEEPLLYTEVTDFPYFGKIYRCQCGTEYSKWYNMENHEELSFDVLLGDELFNDYINLIGVDEDDCNCSSLKNLLHRLILE